MSIDDAIRAITIDAAYQLRMDDKIGSLEVGKYADFVILGGDPRVCHPDQLMNLPIFGTYLQGRSIWTAL